MIVGARRSILYVPGSNIRALEKAETLTADGLILDLEDAVAPDAKASARRRVMESLRGKRFGRCETILRINALDTPWGAEDLAAAAHSGADGVAVPKVGSVEDLLRAEAALIAAGAPEDLALWAMVETPGGVLAAAAIAAATPRLAGLIMGTTDLALSLHVSPGVDRLALQTSLGLCVLAARAAGIAILDGVHLDLDDEAGFLAVCRQGRDLGFDGKTLIHPKTIATANRIFSPTPEEIAWARRVLDCLAEARARGQGVAVLDGRLIEEPHAIAARRMIARAEAIAAGMGPDGAEG
ncbi:MAG: CoA ester lyase [Rhodospirillaceae bacterium]|nr:CoA ester lyase [Rhodospirillaceae bacterium]